MKKSRCANCGMIFESGIAKKKHKKEYPDASCKNLKGGKDIIKMFKKKKKAVSVAPPIEEDDEIIGEEEVEVEEDEEDEEDEVEEVKEKTKAIKRKIVKAKSKEPVEEEEELTEDKVKQILINFETRLQKIEYNLRLAP